MGRSVEDDDAADGAPGVHVLVGLGDLVELYSLVTSSSSSSCPAWYIRSRSGASWRGSAAADGLQAVATARPGEEEAYVRVLGGAETADWSADTVSAVRELHPEGVDGVVDLVSRDPGGFSATAGLARPGGAAVTTLGAAREGAGGRPPDGRRALGRRSGTPAARR